MSVYNDRVDAMRYSVERFKGKRKWYEKISWFWVFILFFTHFLAFAAGAFYVMIKHQHFITSMLEGMK